MTDEATPVRTRVRLARSLPRMLLAPAAVIVAGVAAMVGGVLASQPPASVVLVLLGAVVTLAGGAAAIVLFSIRLTVEPAAVVVDWVGGSRRYALAPGPVTRVRLTGAMASRLRPRSGGFGWGIGRARLRDEEDIDLVRLAPTATAILVPTESIRLAIAPAVDQELLDALAAAAEARQRLEAPEPEEQEPEVDFEPAALTGIERALLEERLARERQEAQAAAALAASMESTPDAVAPPAAAEARPARVGTLRPVVGWVLVLLPTAAAGVAWWLAQANGWLPPPGSDPARLALLALALAGPATSVGAAMALAWWPRLVGVVVAGGLAATILIGRAFVG